VFAAGLKAYGWAVGGLRGTGNIITFYSDPPYSGNAKVIYDYIRSNRLDSKHGLELVWISRSESANRIYEKLNIKYCYFKYGRAESLGCFQKYVRSKVHVCDVPFVNPKYLYKNRGTLFLLTWHGIPFKKGLPWSRLFLDPLVDAALSTSELSTVLLSQFIGVSPDKFRVTGYPRNDPLLAADRGTARRRLSSVYGGGFERVILYLPTYRHTLISGTSSGVEGIAVDFLANLDEEYLREIDRLLAAHNTLLLVKYHYYDELYYKNYARDKYRRILESQTGNIRLLDSEDLAARGLHIYDILPGTDMLVTDYSSIFYDYLLLDRPIVFYMYDVEEYYRRRGLIVEPWNVDRYVPGPVARTPRQLYNTLKDILEGGDAYEQERARMRDLIFTHKDSRSAERVWRNIISEAI